MSYKVAIATSDNITVENHFSRAEVFAIYAVHDDFTYSLEENRLHLAGGLAEVPNCGEAIPEEFEEIAAAGGGCGSGGCGGGGCGGGGGGKGPVDPRLEKIAGALADTQIVIAGTLGPHAEGALARRGIRAFAVSGFVTHALDRLVAFDKFQYTRRVARATRVAT